MIGIQIKTPKLLISKEWIEKPKIYTFLHLLTFHTPILLRISKNW
jgi:hypothetical protein